MQGYDSVMMDIDIEVGGNDQLFNMLAGRDMVRNHLNKEKLVITNKLLTTASGDKMGKSEGNMIKLSDSAQEIYGKAMAFTDEQILGGFELLTSADMSEVDSVAKRLKAGENPMILKKELALKLTSEFKSIEEAQAAQEYFETVFQNKSLNTEIPEAEVKKSEYNIVDLIMELELAPSKSQAKRLIEQGAVKVDESKVADWQMAVTLTQPITIKVGRKLYRILHRP